MMDGTWPCQSQVVVGGNGIDHIDVGTCLLSQLQRTSDDTRDMLHVMGTVELLILRQYLRLDKLDEI
jgi:hypothetical protein